MNIYEVLVMATFIIVTLSMLKQFVTTMSPKLSDVLSIVNALPCDEVRVYKNGKRLKCSEWFNYLTRTVYYAEFNDGVLYISIT